jgi:transketolase
MRNVFVKTLLQLAKDDPRIMLMVGDLGFSVVESFAEQLPDQFLNAGIAEQNMAGVAAGLAMAGFHPFIYSIANFPTLRCLEQIRNDIVYHRQPVTVVAVGGGLAYGSLGYSHHAVQDLACLRTLPGMLMATPGDPLETVAVTRFLTQARRPSYLRLGKGGEPGIHASEPVLETLGPLEVHGGSDRAILACGNSLGLAAKAARLTGASLLSCPLWDDGPETRAAIQATVDRYQRLVVVEEHLAAGGFGSFVRECLEDDSQRQSRIRCRALRPEVCEQVGPQEMLQAAGGLTVETIAKALIS